MADSKYLANYKSNPNQTFYEKSPIPQFSQENREQTVFATINCYNMGLAMADLTPAEFKVWCYLAKNQSGYELAISPADALAWGKISKDTFHKAIGTLKQKKYLVPKEGTKNHYVFYERPEDDEVIFVEKKPFDMEEPYNPFKNL